MAHSDASQLRTAGCSPFSSCARTHGRSCFGKPRGFTLIEVQIAIVLFVFGMLAVLGSARVNGSLIKSVETERAVDGYVDLAAERAIVTMAGEPGTTGTPPCTVRLESIDDSGAFPIVEVSAQRVTP